MNSPSGKVGMANSVSWAEADDGASAEFVDEVRQWFVGWFTHPLFEGIAQADLCQFLCY